MADSLFLDFLLLLALLFFVPKLFHRWVPHPITEVAIGVAISLFAAEFFQQGALVSILATLGIITLFVYAGLEADTEFLRKHKRVFIENIGLFVSLFVLVGIIVHAVSPWGLQVSLLVSLALLTPSASFILSVTKGLGEKQRAWIEGKALAAEISSILLMAVLLSLGDAKQLLLALVSIALLIIVVPFLLTILYKHVFSKLIGTEFSFILVIALFSAYVTELVGLHFLVGAFIAGLVSKRFIESVQREPRYRNITRQRAGEIVQAFGFFAATFAPFYFFSAGLQISPGMLGWQTVLIAAAAFIVVSIVRIAPIAWHRHFRVRERLSSSWRISAMLLPTLVFTFVLAGILHRSFGISDAVFGALMLYGIFSSLVPVVLVRWLDRKRSQAL